MKKRVFDFLAFIFVILLAINFVSSVDEIGNSSNFQSGLNDALEKDIQIPEDLKSVARVVFGIKDGNIDTGDFVVLVCLWIVLLMLIHEAVVVTPIFEKKY